MVEVEGIGSSKLTIQQQLERELHSEAGTAFYLRLLLSIKQEVEAHGLTMKKESRPQMLKGGEGGQVQVFTAMPSLFPSVQVDEAKAQPFLDLPGSNGDGSVEPCVVPLKVLGRLLQHRLSVLSEASPNRVLHRLSSLEFVSALARLGAALSPPSSLTLPSLPPSSLPSQQNEMVDLDMAMRLCMDEWAAETLRRRHKLEALFRAGDVDTNG